MVNKGLGETQENDYKKANKKILEILDDCKPHRYDQLQKETKLSSATLTKHLKELTKGIVKRTVDYSSHEYPPPVYYQLKILPLKDENLLAKIPSILASNIIDSSSSWEKYTQITDYIESLEFTLWYPVLISMSFDLLATNDIAYQQNLEYYILPMYGEAIAQLREKLKDLKKQGVKVDAIIRDAQQTLMKKANNLENKKAEKHGYSSSIIEYLRTLDPKVRERTLVDMEQREKERQGDKVS